MLRKGLMAMCGLVSCVAAAFSSGEWSYVGRCDLWRVIYVENSSGQPEIFRKRFDGVTYGRERISKVQSLPGNKLAFETEDSSQAGERPMRRYYVYETVGDRVRLFELSNPVTGEVDTRNGRNVIDGSERFYQRCS